MCPASILYKSKAGHYRPVSYPDGSITVRCRFIKNAYWIEPLSTLWNRPLLQPCMDRFENLPVLCTWNQCVNVIYVVLVTLLFFDRWVGLRLNDDSFLNLFLIVGAWLSVPAVGPIVLCSWLCFIFFYFNLFIYLFIYLFIVFWL